MKLECEIAVKHIIFIFPNFELKLTSSAFIQLS